ncbi:MAG: DUF3667 domain-containing protein [Pseudomonadales bacterium]|nr:DUF3667 domain-containing protein [Pseudomonadales bacterium]MDP7356896.1 DUF3667 domain-containing protein [Pseudomonadales bacterium]MDP7596007.1 DUF3667 domain-containing protein [Pseudomonadales bacterium]HJN52783.1 DUF3667 domain-containing protein [Pseudomonadales bacterium]
MQHESRDLCPNCGEPLQGPYCFHCGQQQRNIRRFFLSLLGEAFEDLFSLNSRTSKTLFGLLFKPGFLTNEYSAGRKARYIQPVRLYLISSFLFVLYLSVSNMFPVSGDSESADNSIPDTIVLTDDDDADSDYSQADFTRDVSEEINEIHFSWLSEANNTRLRELFKDQSGKVYRLAQEDPDELLDVLLDLIPPVMFLLLPLFAVLLKITYLTSGRYYTEHLILALHNHSFLFLVILISNLLELLSELPTVGAIVDGITVVIEIWIPIYLFLTLKTCYGEGTVVTVLKYLFLSIAYFLLLSMVMLVVALWGFLTL